MDMVHADVGGEPAQHGRQVKMRAAKQTATVQCPIGFALPESLLELVLHVEQPHAHRGCEPGDRQLDEQELAQADQRHEGADHRCDDEIEGHHAPPYPQFGAQGMIREPVPENENEHRPHTEHHERASERPVEKSMPSRQGAELAHSQRRDVSLAAAIEISRGAVMQRMLMAPMVVGGERQHSDCAAQPIVGTPLPEERAVPTIVLDDEQPDQEPRRRQGQQRASTSRRPPSSTTSPARERGTAGP